MRTPPPQPPSPEGEGGEKSKRAKASSVRAQNLAPVRSNERAPEGVAGNLPLLPPDWRWITLGDTGKIVSGSTPSTAEAAYWHGNINWIAPSDLTGYKKKTITKGAKSITELGLKNSSARLMPAGSVLFSSRAPIGYVVIAAAEVCTNQGFKSIIPNENINSEYLYYYLLSSKQRATKVASGTTFKEISLKVFADLPFPLPPLATQQAIVAKIEELFSELDKGIESIKLAQQQLKTYRQSVLKAAFEGSLAFDTPSPSGAGHSGQGQAGELPAGWKWVKLGECLADVDTGKSFRCDERPPRNNEVGIVKVSAVTWGYFNEEESKTCFSTESFKPDYQIHSGDFLFSRANTLELIGACVIVGKISKKLMLSDKILRFTFSENILPDFCLHYLRSRKGRREIERLSTGNQESMRNIGQDKLKQIEVPLPPLAEQQAIVAAIESRLSVADQLEATLAQSLEKAEALRQSVLKQAFEGRLV